MTFQGKHSDAGVFRASAWARPSAASHIAVTPPPGARAPEFLVRPIRKDWSWWGSLKTLCTPLRLRPPKTAVTLFRDAPVAKFRFTGRALGASVLLHLAAFAALSYVPWLIPHRAAPVEIASSDPENLEYRIIKLNLAQRHAPITPAGPGGSPGVGAITELRPATASALHSSITAISRPVHPDNRRQTIYQSLAPPDLKIAQDVPLPNMLVGKPFVVPRPQIHFHTEEVKPVANKRRVSAKPAAPDTLAHPPTAVVSVADLTVVQAHLPVPPSAPATTEAQATGNDPPASAPSSVATGETGGILVVGADPSASSSLVRLPLGNRWGEFATSPSGGLGSSMGSGGAAAGAGHGSTASSGAGGDSSTGVGRGTTGGGGGSAGSSGVVSISGAPGAGSDSGSLEPALAAAMVYPVPTVPVPRHNALVVSAGPVGGGGLNAYGLLHCGRIYTVFLQMPGKSWALQYCGSRNNAPEPKPQRQRNVVVLEQALTPPEADSRFDFRRLPVPIEKRHKMILLKGTITEEGVVMNLGIYQGVLPRMDEAARLAFSRWKFRPALRGDKPVAVDILIGIPSEMPSAGSHN